MATELPDTDNPDVMRMAIAWHIVAASKYITIDPGSPKGDKLRDILINAYKETYNSIQQNEWDLTGTTTGGFSS